MLALLLQVILAVETVGPEHIQRENELKFAECLSIVRHAHKLANSGRTIELISSELAKRCTKVEAQRVNICTTLVPAQVGNIVELTKQDKPEGLICETFGYNSRFHDKRVVAESLCVKIVDDIRGANGARLLADEAPPKNVYGLSPRDHEARHMPFGLRGKYALGICREMKSAQDTISCRAIARFVDLYERDTLKQGTSSTDVCADMKRRQLIRFAEETTKQ